MTLMVLVILLCLSIQNGLVDCFRPFAITTRAAPTVLGCWKSEIPQDKIDIACRSNGRSYPTVYGVGINDIDGESKSIYHSVWIGMIKKCIVDTRWRIPRDVGSVCEEWKRLSTFKAWMMSHDGHWEGRELSTNILVLDNKFYSPETCMFLPKEIVNLLHGRTAAKVDSLGIFVVRYSFGARITRDGKYIHIGYYDTELEARLAFMEAKAEVILYAVKKYLTDRPYDDRAREVLIAVARRILARIAEPDYNPKRTKEKLW